MRRIGILVFVISFIELFNICFFELSQANTGELDIETLKREVAENFHGRISYIEKNCNTNEYECARGDLECIREIHNRTYVIDKETGIKISCKQMSDDLANDTIRFFIQQRKKLIENSKDEPACEEQNIGNDYTLDKKDLNAFFGIMDKPRACESKTKVDKKCITDILCNMFLARSPLQAMVLRTVIKSDKIKGKCPALDGGNCFMNFAKGIFDSIAEFAKFLVSIPSLVKMGANKMLFEKKSSEKILMASQTPKSFIEKYIKDPAQFIKEIGETIIQQMNDAIINHYGCEKWSGFPYISSCITPMKTWGCASCNQINNAICGIFGFSDGEIATSLLFGGLISIVKNAGGKIVVTNTFKLTGKAASSITEHVKKIPINKNIEEGFTTISKANLAVLSKIKTPKDKILMYLALRSHSKTTTIVKKAIPITGNIVKIAVTPLRVYFKLMGEAYKLGVSLTDQGIDNIMKIINKL